MTNTSTQNSSTENLPLIVLGSSSPRRRELLGHVCQFEVIKPDVEEFPRPGEGAAEYASRNAHEKGGWVLQESLRKFATRAGHGLVVISADTIVVVGKNILEKPSDHAHAKAMLQQLSGATHKVITAVCIHSRGLTSNASSLLEHEFRVETTVTFKSLTDPEIDHYIQTGEPFDKAGGYAAQGIGSYMVKHISGSYSNVVGLPMAELVEVLEQKFGLNLF